MRIRRYAPADKDQVIALWHECGLVVPQNDPEKDIQRKLKVDPELFLVGETDGAVIASAMGGYEGHRGWVNYLAVSPAEQRKGHGRAMMVMIEQLLRERGCPKINLQVRKTNVATIAFYQSLGFSDDDIVGLGKRLVTD